MVVCKPPAAFYSTYLTLQVHRFLTIVAKEWLDRMFKQGQARGYGHITQQYLIFGRTTGGQRFQLEYLQRYLKNCFASFIL